MGNSISESNRRKGAVLRRRSEGDTRALRRLLVARSTLGTINAVALTAWTLRARGIPLRGIVLNRWSGDAMQEDSARMCAALADAPIVARVPEGGENLDVAPDLLRSFFA